MTWCILLGKCFKGLNVKSKGFVMGKLWTLLQFPYFGPNQYVRARHFPQETIVWMWKYFWHQTSLNLYNTFLDIETTQFVLSFTEIYFKFLEVPISDTNYLDKYNHFFIWEFFLT